MSSTGPLETVGDARDNMPRYVRQVLDAAQDVDNFVKDLFNRWYLPFTIVWRWQANDLRRKTYQALDRAVSLSIAENLIRRNAEIFGDKPDGK